MNTQPRNSSNKRPKAKKMSSSSSRFRPITEVKSPNSKFINMNNYESVQTKELVKKSDIDFLNFRVRTLVRTFENELNSIFFTSNIIYLNVFAAKVQGVFDGG